MRSDPLEHPDAHLPMNDLLDLPARLAPGHTAVLVIDLQNDFCAPGGWTEALLNKDMGVYVQASRAIGHLVDAAREAGVPVVWVRADYRPEMLPESMRVRMAALPVKAVCCAPGTWGADWFGPRPLPDETVVDKHCYSGFVGTELDTVLRARGIRSLLFAGVQTHACVESTLRDAHSLGYHCVVPEECIAAHTPELHRQSLGNIGFLFGDVVKLDAVRALW